MKNLQQLEAERKELHAKLDIHNNPMPIVRKLKENEKQIIAIKAAALLAEVNRKQAKKRELALIAWECEQPTEDITTADGSLHKVKAKKYPKLAAVQYLRLSFKEGRTTILNINGEEFRMFKTKHEYGKPTEYTRPATFAEFLEFNSIEAQEITSEQFAEFSQKLDEATEELKRAIAKYDLERDKIGCYRMQYIGLVNQSSAHLYTYNARKF